MSDAEDVHAGDLNTVNLTFKEEGYIEPPGPTFHPFPRLPIELQVNILQIACAPSPWMNGNNFMPHFVNNLWYWHSCRQNFISIYSTLMNEFVDQRDNFHGERMMRKQLLRTCRLGREVSLKAIRRDIEANEMSKWEGHEPDVIVRGIAQDKAAKKRILEQIDAMISRTRRDPSSRFPRFLELPQELQDWIWQEAALEEEITTCNYFNHKMLDDMVMQDVYYGKRDIKFPGWYFWFMDGEGFPRPRMDPYFQHPRQGLLRACRASRLAALEAWRRDLAQIDMAKCMMTNVREEEKRDGFVKDLDEKITELHGKIEK